MEQFNQQLFGGVASFNNRLKHTTLESQPPLMDGPKTFGSLPIEVRNSIYKYALVCEHTIKFEDKSSQWIDPPLPRMAEVSPRLKKNNRPSTALLLTSKQIYHEAAPLLYSVNCFYFKNAYLCNEWLTLIGRQNVACLGSLEFVLGFVDEPRCEWLWLIEVILRDMKGLRDLLINLDVTENPLTGMEHVWSFVGMLDDIEGLKRVRMEGYWPGRLPSYLKEKLNVRVVEIDCGLEIWK
jgi:hypothetical protein